MKRKRISIKWKVFLYLIGFCFLLLVILWLFQTVLLNQFYKSIKLREIKAESAVIAQRILDKDWEGLTTSVTVRGDLYVEIWNDKQGTFMFTGNYPQGIQARLTSEFKLRLFREAQQRSEADIKHFISTNPNNREQESILYSKLIRAGDGGGDQLLMVSANISPLDATVETLRIQLVYISGILLVLSVGLALLIARRVSAPIEVLNQTAKELGRGNNGVSFRGEGYREIAELADTLNHTAVELARTDTLRRELIANVSHDLRTPLTLITGYSEMIRDLPDENTAENMQVIIEESKRLTSLVTDLLDLSRLQAGTGLQLTRFCLTGSVREIIGRFARFCEQEGFVILFQQDQDVFVDADPERIAQVVYNFLINAITHAGQSKEITVRQLTGGGRVTIQVQDSGEGIPPEQLPQIWDRYYKVDKIHKRTATGSGLGLSIVKSILEQHPGVEYGVDSQVGVGSTFWFSLERA